MAIVNRTTGSAEDSLTLLSLYTTSFFSTSRGLVTAVEDRAHESSTFTASTAIFSV